MIIFKKIFCIHKYEDTNKTYTYPMNYGYKICKELRCTKCGKIKEIEIKRKEFLK